MKTLSGTSVWKIQSNDATYAGYEQQGYEQSQGYEQQGGGYEEGGEW